MRCSNFSIVPPLHISLEIGPLAREHVCLCALTQLTLCWSDESVLVRCATLPSLLCYLLELCS